MKSLRILIILSALFSSSVSFAEINILGYRILDKYLDSGKLKINNDADATSFECEVIFSSPLDYNTGYVKPGITRISIGINGDNLGNSAYIQSQVKEISSNEFKQNQGILTKIFSFTIQKGYLSTGKKIDIWQSFQNSGFLPLNKNSYNYILYTASPVLPPEPTLPKFEISGFNYFCTTSNNNYQVLNIRPTDSVTWSVVYGDVLINNTNTTPTINVSRGASGGLLRATLITKEGKVITLDKEIYNDLNIVGINLSSAIYVQRLDGRITATIGFGDRRNLPEFNQPFKIYINGVFVKNVTTPGLATFYLESISPVQLKIETIAPCGSLISDTKTILPDLSGTGEL